jgi:hypothetical protein
MPDLLLALVVDLLSFAGLAGLSGGSRATVRAALTPLASTLEAGLSRIPFGLTPLEAVQFKNNLRVLVQVVATTASQHTNGDDVGLNKLVAQLDETAQTLALLNHSDAFAVLTAIREAKHALAH